MSGRPPAYARKKDRNHDDVKRAVIAAGYEWSDTFHIGHGIPDGVAVLGTFRCWVEVKMPGEELTPFEQWFFDHAPGDKIVTTDGEHAVLSLGALRALAGV